MEFTAGWLIIGIASVGITCCAIGLFISGKVFEKQRKKLLQKIERE